MQIVYSSRRGSRDIEHIGSTHGEATVELIKTAARKRIDSGHGELDLGLDDSPAGGGPLEISFSRAGRLWDALCRAYEAVGLAGGRG